MMGSVEHETPSAVSRATRLHHLILSLQDALPDEVILAVRRDLGVRAFADAAETLRFALLRSRTPLSSAEFARLGAALADPDLESPDDEADVEADVEVPDDADPDDPDDPPRRHAFRFEPGAGSAINATDARVLARLGAFDGVLGVWRAVRRPIAGTWPRERLVYLVETRDASTLDGVVETFYGPQAPGPDDPIVDAYVTGLRLPDLHADLQIAGAIVYVGVVGDGFALAPLVHESVEAALESAAQGGRLRPGDLARIPSDEVRPLLDRLAAGRPLLAAGQGGDDVFDPTRTGVVPMDLRTDGRWIWADATAYYLERYGISPPQELLDHLRSDSAPAAVPDIVLRLGVAWLRLLERDETQRSLLAVLLLVQSMHDLLDDDTVTAVRRSVATQQLDDTVKLLGDALKRAPGRPRSDERELLVDVLGRFDVDVAELADLPVADVARPVRVGFDPGPTTLATDEQVLSVLAPLPGVLGVWRCLRVPRAGAQGAVRPWYVVEAVDPATALDVNARFYGVDAPPQGPDDPMVEVYLTGVAQPAVHEEARWAGLLLHIGVPEPEFSLSRVFELSPGGWPTNIEQVDPDDAERMLERLSAGRSVKITDLVGDDVLAGDDPAGTGVVPLGLNTDGRWIWSEATRYYLQRHRVAPPSPFREYLETGSPTDPPADVVVHLASLWLDDVDRSLSEF